MGGAPTDQVRRYWPAGMHGDMVGSPIRWSGCRVCSALCKDA